MKASKRQSALYSLFAVDFFGGILALASLVEVLPAAASAGIIAAWLAATLGIVRLINRQEA